LIPFIGVGSDFQNQNPNPNPKLYFILKRFKSPELEVIIKSKTHPTWISNPYLMNPFYVIYICLMDTSLVYEVANPFSTWFLFSCLHICVSQRQDPPLSPPMFKIDSSSCMVLREAFHKLGNLVKVCCSTRVQAWPAFEPNTLIPNHIRRLHPSSCLGSFGKGEGQILSLLRWRSLTPCKLSHHLQAT
jgi:hypothetical protein